MASTKTQVVRHHCHCPGDFPSGPGSERRAARTPGSPYTRSETSRNCGGGKFSSDQVVLGKNFWVEVKI